MGQTETKYTFRSDFSAFSRPALEAEAAALTQRVEELEDNAETQSERLHEAQARARFWSQERGALLVKLHRIERGAK